MGQAILLGSLAGLVTIAGVLVVKLWHATALRYSHYVNSFAAGLILSAALIALLPEAMDASPEAPLYAVAGFGVFLVLEAFLVVHSGAEVHYSHSRRAKARGFVFFWGLFLHSLLDGVVIAVGFASGARVGLVTALAVIGHELPEGVTTFSLLLEKISPRRAAALAVAVALATPVGALAGVMFLAPVAEALLGPALGLVAGSFIYIAASDIVPEIREENAARNTAFLIAGVAFLAVLDHLVGH